jgi:dGTPase
MDAVEFTFDAQCPAMSTVRLKPETRREVEILKHLNYMLTIRSPRLAVVQCRGYDLVRKIFEALTTSAGRDLLPHDVRALHDHCRTVLDQGRVVSDFIAGMTDRYAVEFYGRLYGGDHTIFKPF